MLMLLKNGSEAQTSNTHKYFTHAVLKKLTSEWLPGCFLAPFETKKKIHLEEMLLQ